MHWQDVVTLIEAAAVLGILALEWRSIKYEKANLDLATDFFRARSSWYNARRATIELKRAIAVAQAVDAESIRDGLSESSPEEDAPVRDVEDFLVRREVDRAHDSKRGALQSSGADSSSPDPAVRDEVTTEKPNK